MIYEAFSHYDIGGFDHFSPFVSYLFKTFSDLQHKSIILHFLCAVQPLFVFWYSKHQNNPITLDLMMMIILLIG